MSRPRTRNCALSLGVVSREMDGAVCSIKPIYVCDEWGERGSLCDLEENLTKTEHERSGPLMPLNSLSFVREESVFFLFEDVF